jgi:ABC-type Na+ efflux pump permease subunit
MPASNSLDVPTVSISNEGNLFVLVNKGIAWIFIIAFVLSIFFIFYGGISFILSGGKEDKIKKAVSTIRYAIIGLIITLLAVTIISIIGKIFNFNFIGDIINFNQIFSDIKSIIDMFGTSSPSTSTSNTPRQLVMWLLSLP